MSSIPTGDHIFAVTICLMDERRRHKNLGAEPCNVMINAPSDMSDLRNILQSLMVGRKINNQTNSKRDKAQLSQCVRSRRLTTFSPANNAAGS